MSKVNPKLYYYWETYPSVRQQLWKTHPKLAKILHNKYRRKQRKYGRYYENWMGRDIQRIQNWGGGKAAVTSNRNYMDRAKIAVRQWARGVYNNEDANVVKRAKISNSYFQPPPPSTTDKIRHGAYVAKDVASGIISGTRVWDAISNFFW